MKIKDMITAKTRLWCLLNSPSYKSLNVTTMETTKYRIFYWCSCRDIFGLRETRKKKHHLLGDPTWKKYNDPWEKIIPFTAVVFVSLIFAYSKLTDFLESFSSIQSL